MNNKDREQTIESCEKLTQILESIKLDPELLRPNKIKIKFETNYSYNDDIIYEAFFNIFKNDKSVAWLTVGFFSNFNNKRFNIAFSNSIHNYRHNVYKNHVTKVDFEEILNYIVKTLLIEYPKTLSKTPTISGQY